ncbi:MAG TPA: hypothetical protein DCE41_06970 [Cytophagales bacterium]|nr:hypothetical protein [Cytophagales bacterium]HAA22044.1 hypothetical protein [Cytophagales bacterium]HAP58585.1 hypothetical protein [Cytophagales bacterium]
MKTPPDSYLIFREELQKQKAENLRLKKAYDDELSHLSDELRELREQITAQRSMMETTVDYAIRLEKELAHLKKQVKETSNTNRSYH